MNQTLSYAQEGGKDEASRYENTRTEEKIRIINDSNMAL